MSSGVLTKEQIDSILSDAWKAETAGDLERSLGLYEQGIAAVTAFIPTCDEEHREALQSLDFS